MFRQQFLVYVIAYAVFFTIMTAHNILNVDRTSLKCQLQFRESDLNSRLAQNYRWWQLPWDFSPFHGMYGLHSHSLFLFYVVLSSAQNLHSADHRSLQVKVYKKNVVFWHVKLGKGSLYWMLLMCEHWVIPPRIGPRIPICKNRLHHETFKLGVI